MGYFDNGEEAVKYYDSMCVKCVHNLRGPCPVWDMHFTYRNDNWVMSGILNSFIPVYGNTDKGKLHNGRCVMYVKAGDVEEVIASRNKYIKEMIAEIETGCYSDGETKLYSDLASWVGSENDLDLSNDGIMNALLGMAKEAFVITPERK